MSEKIRISLDDVHSQAVDQRLQQQSAMARTTEHYRQHAAPVMPLAEGHPAIWRNSLVTAAICGVIGGLCAWLGGELVLFALPNHLEERSQVLIKVFAIADSVQRGEITPSEADHRVRQLQQAHEGNPYVRIGMDTTLSDATRSRLIKEQEEKDQTRNYIQQVILFSVWAVPIALLLAMCEGISARNWRACLISGSLGIVLGVMGGVVVGLFINQLYRAMGGGGSAGLAQQVIARAVGWAILGLFLAIAPGLVLRNLKRSLIGLAGGFAGGLLGGLLFDSVGFATGSATTSRLVGLVCIGVAAGLGTAVLENVAKTGWLKVSQGLIAGKQFVIYRNPTFIGSSPQCEIYLFKDVQVAPQHAAIRSLPHGYEIEDLGRSGSTLVNGSPVSRTRLQNDDRIQIGGTTFLFQEKAKSQTT